MAISSMKSSEYSRRPLEVEGKSAVLMTLFSTSVPTTLISRDISVVVTEVLIKSIVLRLFDGFPQQE